MNLTLHFKKVYLSSVYNLNKLGCLISNSPKTIKNIFFYINIILVVGKKEITKK